MVQHSAIAALVLTTVILSASYLNQPDNFEGFQHQQSPFIDSIELNPVDNSNKWHDHSNRLLIEENFLPDVDVANTNSSSNNSEAVQNGKNEQNESTNATNNQSSEQDLLAKVFKPLHQFIYDGNWSNDLSNEKISPFRDETMSSGRMAAWFWMKRTINETDNSTRDEEMMTVRIINGDYSDDPYYAIRMTSGQFDGKTKRYIIQSENQTIQRRVNSKDEELICQVKVEASFDQMILNVTTIDVPDMNAPGKTVKNVVASVNIQAPVRVHLKSENCMISLTADLTISYGFEHKITSYTFMLTIISIVSFYCIGQIVKKIISNQADAKRYSLLSIGFSTIWDSYICFSHLNHAMASQNYFHLYIMPIFLFFVLFSVFDMKLLVELWRIRYEQFYQSSDQLRRGIMAFNFKFYGALFICLMLFNQFRFNTIFLFLASFILVPQIAHNAMRAERAEGNQWSLYFLAFFKLLIPLYVKGCPESIYNLRPTLIGVALILISIITQVVILELQATLGKRFFIPRRFLPPKFNYLLRIPKSDLESGGYGPLSADDCAICMGSLTDEALGSAELMEEARQLYNELGPRRDDLMRTPCDHKFHVNCLLNWMVIKMECPSCRSQLPSVE